MVIHKKLGGRDGMSENKALDISSLKKAIKSLTSAKRIIELFRQAAKNKLIADVDLWMEFNKARNKTSHIYNEEVAQETLKISLDSLEHFKAFVEALEARL